MSDASQAQTGPEIENLFVESRSFPPDPAFAAQANATAALYDEASADYIGFWKRQAQERISWFTPFSCFWRLTVSPAVNWPLLMPCPMRSC